MDPENRDVPQQDGVPGKQEPQPTESQRLSDSTESLADASESTSGTTSIPNFDALRSIPSDETPSDQQHETVQYQPIQHQPIQHQPIQFHSEPLLRALPTFEGESASFQETIRRENLSAASLPTEDFNALASRPGGATVVELPARNARTRAGSSAEAWKNLTWLAAMVLVFLAAITAGPLVVERYHYAATQGKMRAQYESATDMLSKVSLRDSSITSELVVHRIRPSVVSIYAGTPSRISNRSSMTRGQGSGVVISEDGLIVTNNHVIERAREIVVTLADRREYSAKVIGGDSETDLAVLKIEANDLISAEWGDSDSLELGAAVWAMGSPYGLEQTVTRGIISGKHRRTADTRGEANPHQDLLQTDAAINPGNSGGPLVNSKGQVVGINTSIFGDFFQGISFAVPSSLAKSVVESLIEHGEVRRGFLGVQPGDVSHSDALRLKLPTITGAILTRVTENTPAAEAGLQFDDVIVRYNDKVVDNATMLFRYIGMTSPGQQIAIEYYRDGSLQCVELNVGNRRSMF